MKRFFDILFSFLGILLLLPLLLGIAIVIIIESRGGIFYKQIRVGKDNQDFYLIKFRSMYAESDKKGLLTVGNKDPRVTHIGTFLRKYKLDELPQLFNVIGGQMSLVGPRPEVRKYVEIYTAEQRKVLSVRPGITDYASLQYINENEMLLTSRNPEETYIREIMPAKIELNLRFIQHPSLKEYFRIIGLTIKAIIKN